MPPFASTKEITLPTPPTELLSWKILVLVTAYNSLSQRVVTHLQDVGFKNLSIQFATSDQDMIKATEEFQPALVICPFLTKRVPDVIWKDVITLILHPGPPGDGGPSALDWALLGDTGVDSDSTTALKTLLSPTSSTTGLTQRSHWGITFLQAEEHLDGGPIWAFDQFPLPDIRTTTKSALYQGLVTTSAVRAIHIGLCRIYHQHGAVATTTPMVSPIKVSPEKTKVLKQWSEACVTFGKPFMGGTTLERPLIPPSARRFDFATYSAEDVARIINCGDSQPGATMKIGTSFLFIYDCHLHHRSDLVPKHLYQGRGYGDWNDIPEGTIVATRSGAILFKTKTPDQGDGKNLMATGIWITHARLPKTSRDTALSPKIPFTEAVLLVDAKRLEGVVEWPLESFAEVEGTWQQVFVRTFNPTGALAQMVYFEFYNGAFSTENCKLLLEALKWATHSDRGNVKLLCLMGGKYFSNGIALNIIEHAENPGKETWANINAIDDIVEFLLGDTHSERSSFMKDVTPLCERGIVTVACIRGNAAAGGVAMAAACDVTMAAGSVVLNPAYRAMGLHGSEFHSWSYLKRGGSQNVAAHFLRDMLPISAAEGQKVGLIDIKLGSGFSTREEVDKLAMGWFQRILQYTTKDLINDYTTTKQGFLCAPWSRFDITSETPIPKRAIPLVSFMCENKRLSYNHRNSPPLLHYRNEELSQMLLDSFHPFRSMRYHERRFRFVRKVKTNSTPGRFAVHRNLSDEEVDEEETDEFDDAPNWKRGEEWGWVGLKVPESLETSEKLQIRFEEGSTTTSRSSSMVSSESEQSEIGVNNKVPTIIDGAGNTLGQLPPSPPPSDKRLDQAAAAKALKVRRPGTPPNSGGQAGTIVNVLVDTPTRMTDSSSTDVEENTLVLSPQPNLRKALTDIPPPTPAKPSNIHEITLDIPAPINGGTNNNGDVFTTSSTPTPTSSNYAPPSYKSNHNNDKQTITLTTLENQHQITGRSNSNPHILKRLAGALKFSRPSSASGSNGSTFGAGSGVSSVKRSTSKRHSTTPTLFAHVPQPVANSTNSSNHQHHPRMNMTVSVPSSRGLTYVRPSILNEGRTEFECYYNSGSSLVNGNDNYEGQKDGEMVITESQDDGVTQRDSAIKFQTLPGRVGRALPQIQA